LSISCFISINCYRSDASLCIDGEILMSQEGTAQHHPLAMPFYAFGLISYLNTFSVNQIWYADDAAAVGNLYTLHNLLECLKSIVPLSTVS